MGRRRWHQVLRAIPGAVMLGVGTIFQPKARPDDHWSTSPKVAVVDEADQGGAGAPPLPS